MKGVLGDYIRALSKSDGLGMAITPNPTFLETLEVVTETAQRGLQGVA